MKRSSVSLALFVGLLAALVFAPLAAPAAAQDSKPHVIASFSILADLAQQVAGDAATVDTLIPIGANPHAYQPSARDVAQMSDADLVLVVGLNYEESLLPVVAEAAGERMVVASECVPVRPVVDPTGKTAAAASAGLDAGQAPNAACDAAVTTVQDAFQVDFSAQAGQYLGYVYQGVCDAGGQPSGGAEHAPGSCDPHVWTDPVNAALWALRIRDALSALDAANADTYAANAQDYLAQLVALDQDIQATINTIPEARRTLVTNHLAFDYFARRYGLQLVGVVIPGGSTTAEPSVQEVLGLIEMVQKTGVPAIFTETTASSDLAQQIADETGAKLVPLYTGSLSAPDGPAATYLDYMRYDAEQIAEALK